MTAPATCEADWPAEDYDELGELWPDGCVPDVDCEGEAVARAFVRTSWSPHYAVPVHVCELHRAPGDLPLIP